MSAARRDASLPPFGTDIVPAPGDAVSSWRSAGRQANRGDAFGLRAAGRYVRAEFADDVGGVHHGLPRVPQRVLPIEPEVGVPALPATSRGPGRE